ncbi:MAG TPA: glycosyltransferase family 9 protein [bacterium]|nr:glycosyltransferase family 9 protein [bacterium]
MPTTKFKNIDRILLISLSCIGDVILTTPVMKVLLDNFPGAELTVVAGPTAMPILSRHEWVHASMVFENKGRHNGFKGVVRLVHELRSRKYDMVVDLRNSAIPYFMRSRYRITSHEAHLRNKNDMTRHAVDRHLDVLDSAGIPITNREIRVTVPDFVEAKVSEFITEKRIAGPDRLIAVYPGAGSPYKLYPVEKYRAVVEALINRGDYEFVMVGSVEDAAVCGELAGAFPAKARSIAGELDILELGGLLKQSRLLISNDSGPMHLGVAVGTPTLGVFGPTNANRYGPRGKKHRIVWHREPCNPCKFPECGRESCIGDIDPVQIVEAAQEMLEKDYE